MASKYIFFPLAVSKAFVVHSSKIPANSYIFRPHIPETDSAFAWPACPAAEVDKANELNEKRGVKKVQQVRVKWNTGKTHLH